MTSATLEEAKIVEYYGGCPIVRVPGRLFPVSVVYSKQVYPTSYVQAAVETVLHVHCTQPEGMGDVGKFDAEGAEGCVPVMIGSFLLHRMLHRKLIHDHDVRHRSLGG